MIRLFKIPMDFTLNGWPINKFAIPADVKPFYPLRSGISVADHLLFKSVPSSMLKEIKQRIHEGHRGQKSVKRELIKWSIGQG